MVAKEQGKELARWCDREIERLEEMVRTKQKPQMSHSTLCTFDERETEVWRRGEESKWGRRRFVTRRHGRERKSSMVFFQFWKSCGGVEDVEVEWILQS